MTIFHRPQRLLSVAALAGAALLAGCAAMHTVDTSVATYGTWPAGTAPGTYAFDRLPSQQRDMKQTQAMENAAAQALASAGFRPAPEGTKPAVIVQIGVRAAHFEQVPIEGDFWFVGPYRRYGWAGWAPYGTYGPWGPFRTRQPWGVFPPEDEYLHEVALLIRDASTGKTLYETRVSSDGHSQGGDSLIAAMFDASMREFPQTNEKPHDVRIDLRTVPSARSQSTAASAPQA